MKNILIHPVMASVFFIYTAGVDVWHTDNWLKGTKIINERLLAVFSLFET